MGMPYAVLIDSLSTANFGTGAATTGSFTPTAGRRLVAVVGGQENNGVTDPSADFTIADSQTLTWTKVGDVGNAGNWSHGMVAWTSTAAAATSTTVTFDCAARNVFRYFYSVFEVEGATGTTGYVENAAAATDGAYGVTLATPPRVTDLAVFARILDSSTSSLAMAGGWVAVGNQSDSSGGGSVAVAVRPNSTVPTVAVADTNVTGTSAAKASDMAFVVTAASYSVLPPQPHRRRNRSPRRWYL